MTLPLRNALCSGPIDTLQNLFFNEGYLFFKNFFNKESILELRQLILKVLGELKWAKQVSNKYIAIEPIHRIGSEGFYCCIQELMKKEFLHQIAYEEKLQALLSSLLGDKIFPHPRKMVRISYPFSMNPKDLTPAHQDIFYVRGEPDTFTVWIPLGNYTFKKGGLQVATGSHQFGLYPTRSNDEGRFNCTAAEIGLEQLDWRCTDYEIGDVLIMHSLTLHQAIKNESDEFRISLDCRFSSAYGHINEEQLFPPYYPNIRNWKELCHDWRNRNLFDLPETLQIDSASVSLEDVMNRSSRFYNPIAINKRGKSC